jgi:N-acetylglucosaminyl-diphospho-decaprenol L-rhamnosyltransferase
MSTTDSPRVSVSVVSHGHGALLQLLLRDLAAYVRTPFELILTRNVPEALPFDPGAFGFPIRVIDNPAPRGFGANHNAAFRESRGRTFCLLNPDIRIERDPFPELLACLRDPAVAVAAPLIRNPLGGIEDSARRFPTPLGILRKALRGTLAVDYSIGSEPIHPDWVAGMFMLFPRDAFASLHGFDERYFLYYEDVDLCARIRLAGKRVVLCPGAVAIHDARRESRRSFQHARWHLASMARYFVLWATRLAWRRGAI